MIMFSNMEVAGLLPSFLDEADERGAVEQIDAHYQHGGGWKDFTGFILGGHIDRGYTLQYPGDPPEREVSRAVMRGELIVLFESSWVAVIKPDMTFSQDGWLGDYKVARID